MNKLQLKNDEFRKSVITYPVRSSASGKYVLTQGVAGLSQYNRVRVLQAVRADKNFTEDNDPHKEHDFGVVQLNGVPKIFWKIDYFENSKMDTPSENWGESKDDFINAYRVLTVMFADEY